MVANQGVLMGHQGMIASFLYFFNIEALTHCDQGGGKRGYWCQPVVCCQQRNPGFYKDYQTRKMRHPHRMKALELQMQHEVRSSGVGHGRPLK